MILRSILGIGGWGGKPTQTILRADTGVRSTLTAMHRSRDHGDVHEHTWVVTVWVQTADNAMSVKSQLDSLLSHYSGKYLPDNLAWGEDLARELFQNMHPDPSGYSAWLGHVVCVELCRNKEGLLARFPSKPT